MRSKQQPIEVAPKAPSSDGDFFIPKIVLTGGPASGKTTAINHLTRHSQDLQVVPEAATQVIRGGFPLPNDERPWTPSWQHGLQQAIAGYQVGLEQVAEADALRTKKRGMILDRGLLDGAAYLTGGVKELEILTGKTEADMLNRYHVVVYLGWLAGAYERESNPARFEDEDRAQLLAIKHREVWQAHPKLIEVDSQQHRAQIVSSIVAEYIPFK